jgi:hypothetical protein
MPEARDVADGRERTNATGSSPEEHVRVARTKIVSWLRAASLAFPAVGQWRR